MLFESFYCFLGAHKLRHDLVTRNHRHHFCQPCRGGWSSGWVLQDVCYYGKPKIDGHVVYMFRALLGTDTQSSQLCSVTVHPTQLILIYPKSIIISQVLLVTRCSYVACIDVC